MDSAVWRGDTVEGFVADLGARRRHALCSKAVGNLPSMSIRAQWSMCWDTKVQGFCGQQSKMCYVVSRLVFCCHCLRAMFAATPPSLSLALSTSAHGEHVIPSLPTSTHFQHARVSEPRRERAMSGWSLVQPMLQKRDDVSARHNSKDQPTKTRNQIVRYLRRLRHCGVIFHQHCVSELFGRRDSCLPETTHCSFSCCALSTAHWILPTWPLKSSQRCLATARNYYCDHPTEAVSGSSRYTGMMLSITFRHDPAEASGPQSQGKQDMVLYSNTSCRREPPDVREPDGCLRAETMRK